MTVDQSVAVDESRTRWFTAGDLKTGAISGVIGGVVMGIVAMVISGFIRENIDFWTPIKQVSGWLYGAELQATGFETGPVLVGGATHLVVSVMFGVIFVVLYRRVFRYPLGLGLPFLVGGTYGLVLWGLAELYLPWINSLMAEANKPAFLLGHLAYGATVGLAYEQLRQKVDDGEGEPETV